MDPNQPSPGQAANTPGYTAGPASYGNQVSPPPPSTFAPSPTPKKNRLPWIIAAALIGVLIIISVIVVVLSSDQATTSKSQNTTAKVGSPAVQPATAISVEELNNSLSQDISGLNDDSDFPVNHLDDRALGL